MEKILLLCLLLLGCGKPIEYKVTVIETYLEESNANDGKVEHDWMTTVEIDNGSRAILRGKYGKPGDSFKMTYGTNMGWEHLEKEE